MRHVPAHAAAPARADTEPGAAFRDEGKSREEYDEALAEKLAPFEPDLIVLAGWMHVFSPRFLDRFPRTARGGARFAARMRCSDRALRAGRVINLHPALPGQFAGLNAIQRAHEAFQRKEIAGTGLMVRAACGGACWGRAAGSRRRSPRRARQVHYATPAVDVGDVIPTRDVPICSACARMSRTARASSDGVAAWPRATDDTDSLEMLEERMQRRSTRPS